MMQKNGGNPGNPGNPADFMFSEVFQCYVKSCLLELTLARGMLLGLSWKAKSIVLQVFFFDTACRVNARAC